MQQIRPRDIAEWAKQHAGAQPLPVLLDVREPWEVQTASVPNQPDATGYEVVHMPMRAIPARFSELDRTRPVACLCHHGGRSMQVAFFLTQQGFQNVANVQGGINAWSVEVDPRIPQY